MLWALLALYLFGSSGVSDHFAYLERMRTYFKKEVQDGNRRDELLAIVDSSEKMIKKQIAARGGIVKELSKISERYEATAADIEPVLERYRAEVEKFQGRMIRHRFELKGKMTREEWAKMFPMDKLAEKPAPAQQ